MVCVAAPSPSADPATAAAGVLAERWAEAWNAHDMEAAARLVTADVEFVTVAGRWLRGRGEFLAHHRQIHAMQMRDSRWTNLAIGARAIRNDLALVHLEWAIAGDRDPDGTPRQPREGLFTWLAAREGEAWRIAAAHNADLRTGVRHRLFRDGGGTGPSREQAHDRHEPA